MTSGTKARRSWAAAAALIVLLAGCASSGRHAVSGSTSTSAGVSTTAGTAAAPSATTTPVTLSPALPAPATTGTLHLSGTIPLPLAPGPVLAAEAPDGAVFVAQPTTPVYVVDGDQPAAVAEHVMGGVHALAADATNLYAATYTASATTVFAYDRTSGSEVRQWTLPGVNTANTSDDQLVSLAAPGGALWVSITSGNDVDVYRIDPSSSASPSMLAVTLGAVVGPDGSVYYERSDAHLVRRAPNGVVTVGPVLANAPNGLGGGVQYVDAVAGGVVWVDEPAGQGLDAGYSTFDAVTLAAGGSYSGNTTESGITETLAGPLDLTGGNAAIACPQQGTLSVQCLFRISTTAVLSDPAPVGTGYALVGPYPAVVADNAGGTMLQLDRFS